jgi:acetyl esterase
MHQTLLHPILNTNLEDRLSKSEFDFFNGPVLTVPLARRDIELYIPNARDRDTELASPLLITAKHAKAQPTTLIVNSGADLLRDDGILYGQILQRAGVDVAIFTTHGQLNDSEVLEATRLSETPKVVVRMMSQEIREAIGEEYWMGKNGHVSGAAKELKKRASEEGNRTSEEVEERQKEPAKKRRKSRR